ncbi:MAG: hypothetical protein JF607_26595 [Burkholderiales bacterium]|nr:hypothetical protein [Burkholderiales bacterium]
MKPLAQSAPLNAGTPDRSPEGMPMLAAFSREQIVSAGRLGSGPALGPQQPMEN